VGLKSLKSLNLTNSYPTNKNNKVKSKPLELFELAGKKFKNLDGEASAQATEVNLHLTLKCPKKHLVTLNFHFFCITFLPASEALRVYFLLCCCCCSSSSCSCC
jgi:hypothetical protein